MIFLKAVHSAAVVRFGRDESGATAIEYGLITALIGLAIIGIVFSLGSSINTVLYGQIANALANMGK